MSVARVVVADPLRIFRIGVRNLLTREGDFEVEEAATLEELDALVMYAAPDLVLVDLDLPPDGGIEATRELTRRSSSARVVVWGFDPSHEQVLSAACAGAHGILRKEITTAGLLQALRGVLRGEAPLAPDLTSVVLEALRRMDERTEAIALIGYLSSREREVLGHLAAGARNRQIAETLAISEFTVKRHVQNILQKLELSSRRAAAALYRTAYGAPRAPELMRSHA